ncbi:hypothetical protein [Rhizobacter sp. SG703]|uniref:hypothetical protein n=1 Tax=Rhizobacter sp. SG703 TaxID=2587140 RepID=UPI0014475DDC|nr:hypothetical protein [Rhizobacter sp. SG703]NKI92946.1 hypothetical protein [Rhizobacter sp. SG703]
MKRATFLLKLCYCLNLFGLLVPLALARLGSLPLFGDATTAAAALFSGLIALVLMLAGLYRIGLVVRTPGTLDAWPAVGLADALQRVGSAGLHAGAVVGLASLVAGPWLHAADALLAAQVLAMAGGIGLVGLVLFEFGRLMSFEQRARDELSPQRLRPSPAIEGHSSLDRRKH